MRVLAAVDIKRQPRGAVVCIREIFTLRTLRESFVKKVLTILSRTRLGTFLTTFMVSLTAWATNTSMRAAAVAEITSFITLTTAGTPKAVL
jgi:hypothetical protein